MRRDAVPIFLMPGKGTLCVASTIFYSALDEPEGHKCTEIVGSVFSEERHSCERM